MGQNPPRMHICWGISWKGRSSPIFQFPFSHPWPQGKMGENGIVNFPKLPFHPPSPQFPHIHHFPHVSPVSPHFPPFSNLLFVLGTVPGTQGATWVGEKRSLPLGKFCRAAFGTRTFGSQTPPPLHSCMGDAVQFRILSVSTYSLVRGTAVVRFPSAQCHQVTWRGIHKGG